MRLAKSVDFYPIEGSKKRKIYYEKGEGTLLYEQVGQLEYKPQMFNTNP